MSFHDDFPGSIKELYSNKEKSYRLISNDKEINGIIALNMFMEKVGITKSVIENLQPLKVLIKTDEFTYFAEVISKPISPRSFVIDVHFLKEINGELIELFI